MISLTSAQLDAWMAAFLFPLARILAFLSSAPVIGGKQIPTRIKIGAGVVLTIVMAPVLNIEPGIQPGSPVGLLILVEQIMAGVAMGFALRMVFAAVEMAGELAGLQVGLGFASFYDPQHASFTPVIAQFLGMIASLAFLAMDGHLYMLAALAESFQAFPISTTPPSIHAWHTLVLWGGSLFAFALQLSMPLLAAMLMTNLAIGILTRSAPQLNLMSVGFPLTLGVGFVVLLLSMPYFFPLFDQFANLGIGNIIKIATQMGK